MSSIFLWIEDQFPASSSVLNSTYFHGVLELSWKTFKYLVHCYTGNCEIERILNWHKTQSQITGLIDDSISHSTKLIEEKKEVKKLNFNTEKVANSIVTIKKINVSTNGSEGVIVRLSFSLSEMNHINELIEASLSSRKEAYNTENHSHERDLAKLWDLLMPDIRREGRHTKDWGMIGFQGKDPATDFRAMGILGLAHLIYFAENYPVSARNALADSNNPSHSYPFAITGISITAFIVKLLEDRQLNYLLYQNNFNLAEIYCVIFTMFNAYYKTQQPKDLMDFGPIYQRFRQRIAFKLYYRQNLLPKAIGMN